MLMRAPLSGGTGVQRGGVPIEGAIPSPLGAGSSYEEAPPSPEGAIASSEIAMRSYKEPSGAMDGAVEAMGAVNPPENSPPRGPGIIARTAGGQGTAGLGIAHDSYPQLPYSLEQVQVLASRGVTYDEPSNTWIRIGKIRISN